MLTPDWPAPPNVRALCTTRDGGISPAPYDGLNLGDHVGDAPANVDANRTALQRSIGARAVFLQQVHGTVVASVDARTSDGTVADASTTCDSGVACTVMVADCLPVLFTDLRGERIAAAHAGWRGLADGVLELTFKRFRALPPVDSAQAAIKVIAWMGPCIGPSAFQVGSEVKAVFEAQMPQAHRCFRPAGPEGKWLADLPGLARQRLLSMGVDAVYGNDGSDAWCTVSNPSRFFSYRRDGVTGRLAALIWKL